MLKRIFLLFLLASNNGLADVDHNLAEVQKVLTELHANNRALSKARLTSEIALAELKSSFLKVNGHSVYSRHMEHLSSDSNKVLADVDKILKILSDTANERDQEKVGKAYREVDSLKRKMVNGHAVFFKRYSDLIRSIEALNNNLEFYIEELRAAHASLKDERVKASVLRNLEQIEMWRQSVLKFKDDLNNRTKDFSRKIDRLFSAATARMEEAYVKSLDDKIFDLRARIRNIFVRSQFIDRIYEVFVREREYKDALRYLDQRAIINAVHKSLAELAVIRKEYERTPGALGPEGAVIRSAFDHHESNYNDTLKETLSRGWRFYADRRQATIKRAIQTGLLPHPECKDLYSEFMKRQESGEITYESYLYESSLYAKIYKTCLQTER